jgi:hypothetical protein
MNQRNGKHLIVNTQTIINGRPMQQSHDAPMMPWIELSEDQKLLIARGHTPTGLCNCAH